MTKSEGLGRLQEPTQLFSCTLNMRQVYKLRNSSLDSLSLSLSVSRSFTLSLWPPPSLSHRRSQMAFWSGWCGLRTQRIVKMNLDSNVTAECRWAAAYAAVRALIEVSFIILRLSLGDTSTPYGKYLYSQTWNERLSLALLPADFAVSEARPTATPSWYYPLHRRTAWRWVFYISLCLSQLIFLHSCLLLGKAL